MASLQEERVYGLSCGRVSSGSSISVLHVRLTDSALRAFEGYRATQVRSSQLLIRFNGNQGKILIPQSENGSELQTFTFDVTNVGRDNPQGSFDCIQQYISSEGSIQLDCLGGIQEKIIVRATDDSYQKARENMAQVEEETRSRGAIVIKPGGRYVGKKVQIRKPVAPSSDVAPSRRTSRPVLISSSAQKKGAGQLRPLRERLMHLLALKPYRKPELILRLQKDGLSQLDKDSLDSHLQQVANLNSKDSTFTLKDFLLKDIQKDWPGYTEGDLQLLKGILSRRQNSSNPLPASPPKESASSPPSQKRPAGDFIDPLANKKPRISHLASKASAVDGKLGSTNGKAELGSDGGSATNSQQLPVLDIPRPFEVLSDVSNDSSHNGRDCDSQEISTSERSGPQPSSLSVSVAAAANAPSISMAPQDKNPLPLKKSKKKSKKHKVKERSNDKQRGKEKEEMKGRSSGEEHTPEPHRGCEKTPQACKSNSGPLTGLNGVCDRSGVPPSSSQTPDFLLKYSEIRSPEQRQRYKNDFNAEYSEYRALHARIEGITRQFTVLDNQLKRLQQGTEQYKTIHNQILQEYHKIKKTNPNYSQEKNRCEYLHNKLAHIKKLIAEFDQQQL
uniref:Elongation factor RNA polymerase II n=1 Tax=Oryzias latipes TaxID=8090 RepID=A0A3P9LPL2_ORYLA